jgi:predicted nucleic acid-binding Zn ribbon protein
MPSTKKRSARRTGPSSIGDVVGELMAQTGFARVHAAQTMENVWREAVGEAAARYTRPGKVRRGVLEVGVANSTILQELVFQKAELLTSIRRLLPDTPIRDLRFQVVSIDRT